MARRRSTSTRSRTAARRASALKGWRTRRANAAKRSAAARRGWKTRAKNERKRYRLKREKDIRRKSAADFPFGANVRERTPQTERADRAASFQEEPDLDVIDDLYDYIEEYEDADYYDWWDVEVTPSYKGRGK